MFIGWRRKELNFNLMDNALLARLPQQIYIHCLVVFLHIRMCSIRVSEWFKSNLKLRSQLLLYSLKPAQCVPQPRGQGGVVGGGGGTWVNICWACATGLSVPLTRYSQLLTPSSSLCNPEKAPSESRKFLQQYPVSHKT